MLDRLSANRRFLIGSALASAGMFFGSSAAQADCLPDVPGTTVICNTADADGYQTTTNAVTIRVQPGVTVGTGAATPSPLLSAGTTSLVNNEGTINSAATAISLGGGSSVNNAATGPGRIFGAISLGATTGTQVNTFNNLGNTAFLTGNLNSAGALAVNNLAGSTITGNISAGGSLNVNNRGTITGTITGSSGADTVANNTGGFISGNTALGGGDDNFTIASGTNVNGNVDLGDGNNSFTNAGTLSGNLTAGSGNDTATNSFNIVGNVNLGDGNNTINNTGSIVGNVTTGTGNDSLANSGSGTVTGNIDLGTGADTISGLVGVGTINKTGSGTLTLTGNNTGFGSGGTVLNVNGGGTVSIGASNNLPVGGIVLNSGTLQTTGVLSISSPISLGAGGGTFNTGADTSIGSIISGAGGLTKTGTANLILTGANTYSGGTTISAGTLTGNTTSLQGNIVNNSALVFNDLTGGTYAGNISGSGTVTNSGTTIVTFSGNNTYTGATNITGGALAVNGTGIGDTSAVTVSSGAFLRLNANETIGSLAGAGTVNGAFTLTTGGNNGSTTFSGPISIAGITKTGTGTFTVTGLTQLTTGLAVNGGGVAIGGTFVSPANSVASGATLNVLSAGTLTGNVTAAAGSTTIVNGAVTGNLANAGALSGTGIVNGAVTNTGTLAPGNAGIGIFRVNGSYSQSAAGTLAIEVQPAAAPVAGTNYDQLLVSGTPGTAALAGTLALSVASGAYTGGATYDIVRASGGITGSFATITGNILSPFITLTPTGIVTISGTNQVYRLTVSRTPFATGIGAGATANQIAVATGFQALVNGATGDAATLVSQVDLLTAAQAQQFFDQASPEPYGAYAVALSDQGDLFSRQVYLQMHDTPNLLPGLDLWIRGYGQWGNGDDRGFRFGSDQDTWGVAGGATYRAGNFYFGAAAGWSRAKIDYALGNSSGRSRSWQGGIFAGYQAGPISIDAQLNYIHSRATVTRTINVASIVRAADARPRGREWKFIGTVGYDFDLGGLKARPFVGVDYTNGSLRSFTETGAGAASLTVNRIKTNRTDLLVGLDLKANPNSMVSPYGTIAYRHNLSNRNDDISAFFNGNPASGFTVSYAGARKSSLDVDAGINIQPNPHLALFAGYQGTFRKEMNSHGFSAGLSYSFGAAAPPPAPPAPPPPPPPPPPPATQTCPDGSVIEATATCPAPPPPPPPPPPAPERGD